MSEPKLRIAVGQISSESNDFVGTRSELSLFYKTGYLLEGERIFDLRTSGTEIGGILATLEERQNVETVPLLAARGTSSGPLSQSCYEYLRQGLLAPLRNADPVDGVILSFHGSMHAVGQDDPEGDIAAAVRESVGPSVPIVLTLDLHANVTSQMVAAANAILAYEHYPHDDVYTTGVRGARLLMKSVLREAHPVIAHARIPMLLTAFNSSTLWDTPYARLMKEAKLLEKKPGILSASLFLVGSYLDVPDIGCSALIVADKDLALAEREARQLADAFWARRQEFRVETFSVSEAVRQGRKIEGKPVLLLDTADTTGGGASGDGVGIIKGLLEIGVGESSFAAVVDPEAARSCFAAGVGSEISVELGHKLDGAWGKPLSVTGKVMRLSEGNFTYTGGILGGTHASMGPSAVLQTGSVQMLITSYPTYEWADEQYRSMGMNPETAKFVGVKNMMNFRLGYCNVMKGFFILDLPGPTPPDMRMLTFARVTRPLFPLDEGISSPDIRVSTSAPLQ